MRLYVKKFLLWRVHSLLLSAVGYKHYYLLGFELDHIKAHSFKIKLSKKRSEINVSKGKKKKENFYLRWLEHRCLLKHLYSLYEIPFYYEIIHSDVEEDDVSNKDTNLVYFDITCYLAILSLSVKAIKTISIIILGKSALS